MHHVRGHDQQGAGHVRGRRIDGTPSGLIDRHESVFRLQRTTGNAAVAELLGGQRAARRRSAKNASINDGAGTLDHCDDWPIQRIGDFEIGGRTSAPGQTDTIYFDRKSSTIPASEVPKITASISAFGSTAPLFLDGYASEEEGFLLGLWRAARVSLALGAATPPHTGPRTTRNQRARGAGRIDYANLRKVQIQPPTTSAGGASVPPAPSAPVSLTRPCGTALANCKPRALSMLATAIGALATPNAATNAHLGTFFGAGGVASASTIRTNLTNLRAHIVANTSGARVACHTEVDPGCVNPAFNTGTGATAVMTLCPAFLDRPGDVAANAKTLIHEAAHGTTGLATRDIAYGHTRLIHALSTSDALANTDSYVLLIENLVADTAGSSGPAGGVSGDSVTGLSAANTMKARVALAHLEKWLTVAYQDVAFAYGAVHQSISSGAWAPTSGFHRETLRLIAPMFGLTDPGTSAPHPIPTAQDRERLAAIHDRFKALRSVMWSRGVAISAGPSSSWASGPGAAVQLDPSFFALPDDVARIHNLLWLIAASHPDISLLRRFSYGTAANSLRKHRGLGP